MLKRIKETDLLTFQIFRSTTQFLLGCQRILEQQQSGSKDYFFKGKRRKGNNQGEMSSSNKAIWSYDDDKWLLGLVFQVSKTEAKTSEFLCCIVLQFRTYLEQRLSTK